MRILWISKHLPLQVQIDQLQMFPNTEIIIIKNFIPSVKWLYKNYIKPKKPDIIIPVLPLTMVKELIELSKKLNYFQVWWVEMETVKIQRKLPIKDIDYNPYNETFVKIYDEDGNIIYKIVRFKGFYKIKDIKLELEEIKNA